MACETTATGDVQCDCCRRPYRRTRVEQKFCCRDCAHASRRHPPPEGPSEESIREWEVREERRRQCTAAYLAKKPFRQSVNATVLTRYGLSADLCHAAFQLGITAATLRKRIQRTPDDLLRPYRKYGPRPVTVLVTPPSSMPV